MRHLVILAAVVLQATPAAASAEDWYFKTPGGAAYCRFEGGRLGGFSCMTPNDGFWIRLTHIYGSSDADVRKG